MDTCRDAPRRRDDYRTNEKAGAVIHEKAESEKGGGRINPLALRRSIKFQSRPRERRSADKLTKGECAGGFQLKPSSPSSPLIYPRYVPPSALDPSRSAHSVSLRPARLTSDRGNNPVPSDCHFPACIRTACFFSIRASFSRACSSLCFFFFF